MHSLTEFANGIDYSLKCSPSFRCVRCRETLAHCPVLFVDPIRILLVRTLIVDTYECFAQDKYFCVIIRKTSAIRNDTAKAFEMCFLCNAGRLKLKDIKLKSARVSWHERNTRVWETCENATELGLVQEEEEKVENKFDKKKKERESLENPHIFGYFLRGIKKSTKCSEDEYQLRTSDEWI